MRKYTLNKNNTLPMLNLKRPESSFVFRKNQTKILPRVMKTHQRTMSLHKLHNEKARTIR